MTSTQSKHASEVGVEILKAGSNAIDAVIASVLALGV